MTETDKLREHPKVILLKDLLKVLNFQRVLLIGGAVVDILEGREPKDYDFIGGADHSKLTDEGFKFLGETKTANTYVKDGFILQFLKTSPQEFDFKIGQATYDILKDKLEIDQTSFENKMLIPLSFDSSARVLNSLQRVPHWNRKGYTLPDSTYLSLLNVVGKKEIRELQS